MNSPTIPLSDLRNLWRQAQYAGHNPFDITARRAFRGYVQQEIARRTIAELRAQVERLTAELAEREAWEVVPDDVPLNSFGDYMHNETLFIRCTIVGNGSILHGYTLNNGEYLVRRTSSSGNAAESE